MTVDELRAAIAEKQAAFDALGDQVRQKTEAARALNAENRELTRQRKEIRHEIGKLEHDLSKAEKEHNEKKLQEASES